MLPGCTYRVHLLPAFVSDSSRTTYIRRDNRTLLMNLHEEAAQFITYWIVQLIMPTRDATVPLPNANFEQ